MAKKMRELVSKNINIKFTDLFKYTSVVSILIVIAAIVTTLTSMKYGVDFRGGAEIQVQFSENVSLARIRDTLGQAGFEDVTVQSFGDESSHEVLVKVKGDESNLNQITTDVEDSMEKAFSAEGMNIRKVDIVGPKAGARLRLAGFQAMFWALVAIMIYIGLRFDFKYAPGAIAALFHDVSIILGIYALTGTQFTLQTVAALLAVIGYSVNDTVVIYDRVREHESMNPSLPLTDHINNAINETLSRTVLTSGTTLFISLALFFMGGPAIHDFFLAITLGVIIGTYSSVFVSAPVTLLFDRLKKKRQQASKSAAATS